MPIKPLNRESLLSLFASLRGGLSPGRETVDQSDRLVFAGGEVLTYQGEVCCRAPLPLGEETPFAVRPDKLLKLLEKLTYKHVTLRPEGGKLLVLGVLVKDGQTKVRNTSTTEVPLERDILLPLDKVERPGAFRNLPEGFNEAVGMARGCCAPPGARGARWEYSCVHVSPSWVAASDGTTQTFGYALETGLTDYALLRPGAAEGLSHLEVNAFCEGKGWLHFKNDAAGVVLSCLKIQGGSQLHNLAQHLEVSGEGAVFPPDAEAVLDRAGLFAGDKVEVRLEKGGAVVVGDSEHGRHTEKIRKVVYAGPPRAFLISPAVLREVLRKNRKVTVGESRLKVSGGGWEYVTVLYQSGRG